MCCGIWIFSGFLINQSIKFVISVTHKYGSSVGHSVGNTSFKWLSSVATGTVCVKSSAHALMQIRNVHTHLWNQVTQLHVND